MAKKVVAESSLYAVLNDILYFVGPKQTELSRVVVPRQMRQKIMQEYHDGRLAGHFSGPKLYRTLVQSWWSPQMYSDTIDYANSCPQCAVVRGTGRQQKPPLHPIITECPFQIVGVDIMELPITSKGNRYVIVFQDLFTKLPMVFPTPDQKAVHIPQLLVEIIPTFEVPEAILSDKGTNLLSFLIKEICKMMGIEKLNTTASHPRCNGAVEKLNRTLKTMHAKEACSQVQPTVGSVPQQCFVDLPQHTPQFNRGENHHFYHLVLTVGLRQRQLYYHPSHLLLLTSMTTENR